MGRHSVYQDIFLPQLLQRMPARSSHSCVVPCITIPKTWHGNRDVYLPPDLHSATHVYIRHNGHKPPLTRPYEGPFRVARPLDKHFTLDINGKLKEVTVDRLKPAKLTRDHDTLISDSSEVSGPPPSSFPAHSLSILSRDHACSPELAAQDEALAHPPTTTKTGHLQTSTLG